MPTEEISVIRPEEYIKFRFPSTPELSPDGKTLIFSIRSIKDEENTYRSALFIKKEGKKGYKKLTTGTHVDTSPKISPKGDYLAFLSSRTKKTQVYLLDINGGEAFPVTAFPQGVKAFAWNSEGTKLHIIARVNQKELDKVIKKPKDLPSFILDPEEYKSHKAKVKAMIKTSNIT